MIIAYSFEHLKNLATLIDLIFGDVVLASFICIYINKYNFVCVRSKHIPNIHQIILVNRYEYNIEN